MFRIRGDFDGHSSPLRPCRLAR